MVDGVALNGCLQIDDAGKGAVPQASSRWGGEEGFDRIEPGSGGRCRGTRPARMPRQPSTHLRVLVGGGAVEDGMDHLASRHARFDGVDEADELAVPVALHAAADHGAIQNTEGGKQRRGAVARVVGGLGG